MGEKNPSGSSDSPDESCSFMENLSYALFNDVSNKLFLSCWDANLAKGGITDVAPGASLSRIPCALHREKLVAHALEHCIGEVPHEATALIRLPE
jgi:hypothetical protein